jgi:non-ribosomal peptide synthetase component F
METVDLSTRHSQFEITLTLEEAGGQLFGCWHYNRDLFDEATIVELGRLYEQVLREMCRVPGAKVSDLNLLDAKEEKKVLVDLNETLAAYEKDGLLHELIEAVALENDAGKITPRQRLEAALLVADLDPAIARRGDEFLRREPQVTRTEADR